MARASAGMTKTPCHGCGAEVVHEKGTVCLDCAAAIKAGRELLATTEVRGFRLGWAPHCDSVVGAPGLGEALHRAAVAASVGEHRVPMGNLSAPGATPDCRLFRQSGCDTQAVNLNPMLALALHEAFVAATKAVEESYAKGKTDGRRLLIGLNDGTLSLAEFERRAG